MFVGGGGLKWYSMNKRFLIACGDDPRQGLMKETGTGSRCKVGYVLLIHFAAN